MPASCSSRATTPPTQTPGPPGSTNNVLVLGCSGGGKTRHHVKPNLMQCQGSYIVLDGKGRLWHEMAPFLALNGYKVDRLDFTSPCSDSIGYDPLAHVRWCQGEPVQSDIILDRQRDLPHLAARNRPLLAARRVQLPRVLHRLRLRGDASRRPQLLERHPRLRGDVRPQGAGAVRGPRTREARQLRRGALPAQQDHAGRREDALEHHGHRRSQPPTALAQGRHLVIPEPRADRLRILRARAPRPVRHHGRPRPQPGRAHEPLREASHLEPLRRRGRQSVR